MASSKSVVRRQMVEPINMVKLMGAIGPTRAAARLGVSSTLLHKAKKDNLVNRVVEIAASHSLEHLAEDVALPTHQPVSADRRGQDAVFLLAVTADKAPLVERMAQVLGAELVAA